MSQQILIQACDQISADIDDDGALVIEQIDCNGEVERIFVPPAYVESFVVSLASLHAKGVGK
jgi:hypothetical protein